MRLLILAILATTIVAGCDIFLPEAPESEGVLAEPIDGLTDAQLATHIAGDQEFARVFGPESGLGPVFVAASCETCHAGDGKGHPLTTLTRFGKYENGSFDPMLTHGGPQLQHRAIPGYPEEKIPEAATGVTLLMPPAVTGLGFLEAVRDETLLALADPDDSDGDGISGVPNWVEAPEFLPHNPDRVLNEGRYIGRFGKKASTLNLLHQTVTAYHQDMGVTSDFIPDDLHNPAAGTITGDNAPDPEASSDVVSNVVFYIRTLKVPPRRDADQAEAGRSVFFEIGCADCHVESLTTGQSDIATISNKTIYPYSDMLLHDMGPGLDDGYTEGTALTSEWRTAPLWGLGLVRDSQGGQPFYLHDGRARTLVDAILMHGGEASASRDRFESLSDADRVELIRFLESL